MNSKQNKQEDHNHISSIKAPIREEYYNLINTFEHYSPPGIWGVWKTIRSHIGGNTFTIDYEPITDTAVVGQVKYFTANNTEEIEDFYQEVTITTGGIANIDIRFKAALTGSVVRGTISPYSTLTDNISLINQR